MKIAPSGLRGSRNDGLRSLSSSRITFCRNWHLFSANTGADFRLPRFHRADPSTSLDKRTFLGHLIVKRNLYITENLLCQILLAKNYQNFAIQGFVISV
jgi:hypothetical protein